MAENLFEPFGARAPGRQDGSGAGLGLAICHRLVEALGGNIGFRNRRTGGALFWFDLPYGRIRTPDQRRGSSLSIQRQQGRREKVQRCLLVDDDVVSRMISADQIRRLGMEVAVVESADAARAMAAATAFDVFVIDYHLPDGDGASLASELRQLHTRSKAHYVALTANADVVISANGGSDPFDRLLTKPVSSDALAAAMKSAEDPPEVLTQTTHDGERPLVGVSPRIVDAVASAFTSQWEGEVQKLKAAMANGDLRRLADIAHRIASSCATVGITGLAAMLKELEVECRRREQDVDLQAWQTRLAPALYAAPGQVQALVSAPAL